MTDPYLLIVPGTATKTTAKTERNKPLSTFGVNERFHTPCTIPTVTPPCVIGHPDWTKPNRHAPRGHGPDARCGQFCEINRWLGVYDERVIDRKSPMNWKVHAGMVGGYMPLSTFAKAANPQATGGRVKPNISVIGSQSARSASNARKPTKGKSHRTRVHAHRRNGSRVKQPKVRDGECVSVDETPRPRPKYGVGKWHSNNKEDKQANIFAEGIVPQSSVCKRHDAWAVQNELDQFDEVGHAKDKAKDVRFRSRAGSNVGLDQPERAMKKTAPPTWLEMVDKSAPGVANKTRKELLDVLKQEQIDKHRRASQEEPPEQRPSISDPSTGSYIATEPSMVSEQVSDEDEDADQPPEWNLGSDKRTVIRVVNANAAKPGGKDTELVEFRDPKRFFTQKKAKDRQEREAQSKQYQREVHDLQVAEDLHRVAERLTARLKYSEAIMYYEKSLKLKRGVPSHHYRSKYYRDVVRGEFPSKKEAVEATRAAIMALKAPRLS